MDNDLLADIARSGITPEDLRARPAGPSEFSAVGVPASNTRGYVIPYFDIHGDAVPFYRVKLLNREPKYKQPSGTTNYIYYPPNFLATLRRARRTYHLPPVGRGRGRGQDDALRPGTFVLLTEGEKKAVAACKAGFPTVALGGVHNWQNRTIILPADTELKQNPQTRDIKARIPKGSDLREASTLAVGMQDLINFLVANHLTLFIVFDSDNAGQGDHVMPVKVEVQKAAALLGYELRFHGIPLKQIRQLILPSPAPNTKMGLDDYLMKHSPKDLYQLLEENWRQRTAFPQHPNLPEYLNRKLQRARLPRRELQNLAISIICTLDSRGKRLRSKATTMPYFFDSETKRLIPAALLHHNDEPMHESAFGTFLYQEFGLSVADHRLLQWLATQFTGEEPVEEVEPKRVLALLKGSKGQREDAIALQISDSQFVVVSGDENTPLQLCDNGDKGILFEQDQVDALDTSKLFKAFDKMYAQLPHGRLDIGMEPWWLSVLDNVSLSGESAHAKELMTLLFYASPWLNRWRGTQLPVELAIGEAGSGKSSLYSLRLSILTGRPHLRNVPTDLRDWYASVVAAGGLHVIDNVMFTNKDLRQRISDEVCRIITEPHPHIEMRKLYTTSTQIRMPVNVTFAMTAIQQPFHNADLLQRAAVFGLEAIKHPHDGDWVQHQIMRFGGREKWLAHHLVVLHKFLDNVVSGGAWDTEYSASHRLAHYEQVLCIMAQTLGFDPEWIPEELVAGLQVNLSEADWALEGLKVFAALQLESARNGGNRERVRFTATDIAEWAQASEDFADNSQLTNARRLGRYMHSHRNVVERIAGIKQLGTVNNRKVYTAVPVSSREM